MVEEAVAIETATHTLAASITRPAADKPQAIVVMFAGSGPIDRNENLPNFAMNIFNALADSFATANVASVRYDKRGCGASGGDYITAGHSDFVEDARHVVQFVREQDDFKQLPIVLLGHSEGAAIAPQVAQTIDVDGLILLCPFARPMREVLLQQAINRTHEVNAMKGFQGMVARSFMRLRGGFVRIQQKFLKRIEHSTGDTVNFGKATMNAKWFREMLALDIQTLLKNIQVPTFALGGGKDTQCDPLDTVALHHLVTQAPITTHVEENLTHILRLDDEAAGMARYPELVKQPIDDGVAERCIAWMQETLRW